MSRIDRMVKRLDEADRFPRVDTYTLTAPNGRHIRKATRVVFADGHAVDFMERMSRRDAIQQATAAREVRR